MFIIKPFLIAAFIFGFFSASARAQEAEKFVFPDAPDFASMTLTGEAQVDSVIDPLRVRLQDGRIVQLAGLDIPDLTPYETGDVGMTALDILRELLKNRRVLVYQSKDKSAEARMNRIGYQLAHLVEKNDRLWIQGALLANGLARVRPAVRTPDMVADLLALETRAREGKRGLWADPCYAVLSPETAAQGLHGWAIVEGTVRGSAMVKNTVYLNFGMDWRSDFTVGVSSAQRRIFNKSGIDPLQLAHKKVRVRGWVEDFNGPYIDLQNPVWIEVLPEGAEAPILE